MTTHNCIFIYADTNPEISETIESTIAKINEMKIVKMHSIKTLKNSNNIELRTILTAIDTSTLVLCDITQLSVDLLFILGYAIAKNKPLWFSLNSSFPDSQRNLKRLSLLGGIHYEDYQNSFVLRDKFFKAEPYNNYTVALNDEIMKPMVMTKGKTLSLFYLKCESPTDASIHLTRRLDNITIPIIVDDPLEVASQPLAWYAENLWHSYAIITHFMGDNRQSTLLQNEKYALVCGLAHGYDKQILMLAQHPFKSQLIQTGFLHLHSTAAECVKMVDNWLPNIEKIYHKKQEEFVRQKSELDTSIGLQRVSLGEFVAEQEESELKHYFIDTTAYKNALKASQYMIFVGRKGSGKTANLQQLNMEVSSDKRNHVCLITPTDYELEGILELLNTYSSKADSGYLLESLWKYLIYTELAQSVYSKLKQRPTHATLESQELKFIEYMDKQVDLMADFTVRMEYAIQELCQIEVSHNIREQRVKVSEILHSKSLGEIQSLLSEVLADKHKVYILVDNLDKAWRNRSDIKLLSDFLFGLLSAGQELSSQIRKGNIKRKGINFVLIVYLRSDIFDYISDIAREKDKLPSEQMDWNDPQLLRGVIEQRFIHSIDEQLSSEDIWNEYFVSITNGMSTRDYILRRIIPRPRDIIYFCREALSQAINHKHARIEEVDINRAEKIYSDFAFKALLAETKTLLAEIEDLLYEFVGCKDILSKSDIEKFIKAAGIAEDKTEYAIDLLCQTTFLGLETQPGYFEFLYNSNKTKVLKKQAEMLAKEQGQYKYKVNIPFHLHLEIEPTEILISLTPKNAHKNIVATLIPRMAAAFAREDYSDVLHTCASIFETMIKHIINKPSIQNQSLGSFINGYKNVSSLPPAIIGYIQDVYNTRNITPLAGHGNTAEPPLTKSDARILMEFTKTIVLIEYDNLNVV